MGSNNMGGCVQCKDSPLPLSFLDAIPLHEVLSQTWGFDESILLPDALTVRRLSIKAAIEARLRAVEATQDTDSSAQVPSFCNSDSALQDCEVSCTTPRKKRRGWNSLHLGLQIFLYVLFLLWDFFLFVVSLPCAVNVTKDKMMLGHFVLVDHCIISLCCSVHEIHDDAW
jgi:hypothetical protein